MTRTRNPQRRIWWGVEVLEREESHGGGAEEVVDRKCWRLHRPGSKKVLDLVFLRGRIPSNEIVRRGIQSRLLLEQVLELEKWCGIRKTAPEVYIPLEEGSWGDQDVNDFDSRRRWREDVERTRMRT